MEEKARKTGIEIVGDAPWGTHFCQFYQTKHDLIDVLVPYFKAGLKNNEFCTWVTSEPLNVEDAKKALKKKVKGLDDYIEKGQIEILDYSQWYTKSGGFNSDRVLRGWVEKEKQALEKGFDGLRLTGNTFWLKEKDWKAFTDYEAAVNSAISQHRMLALCTYYLDKCSATEVMDVVSNHQFALIRREGEWEIIESAEHRETAEALRENEEKYRAIFEQAADSIVLIDAETGALVEFNDRAYESLGYTREEFQRLKIPDFEVIESREQVAKHIVEIVGQGADAFETRHRTKSGEIRDILVSSRRISIGGKDLVQSIWRDITERKQAEEALARSEERYGMAQRAANVGSWDWNILTGALVWSEQIEPMFGFGKGEFGGTYEAFLDCVHPEDRQFVSDSVDACIERSKDYKIEHRIVCPDGAVRWVSETGDVIRDKSGTAIRMLGIVQDITERKDTEQRQQLAGRILECLNREVAGMEIIRDVLALIKESAGFEAVGIRMHEGDDFPYFITKGFGAEFIEAENYLCARDENGEIIYDSQGKPHLECMCGNVLRGRTDPASPLFTEGGSFWSNSTTKLLASTSPEERMGHTRNRCNQAGYESVALIPLRSKDEIVGLLQLNDSRPGRFTAEMIHFLEKIGVSVGIALARIRAEEDVKNLAKFPSEDPYPVLRIAKDGTILYANSAGSELLEDWGCEVGAEAPEHWCLYILRILRSGWSEELEVACGDRTFSLITAPVVEAGYVNIYGIDITERKRAEEDLRKYRHHLEELVEERTEELTEANKQLLEEVEGRKRLEKEILNISEREQQRLGEELHDSLGQQLTGVAFMTKVLEQKLSTKSAEEAADVAEIAKLVKQATVQARGLARGLNPVDLDANSLMSSLQELAASMEQLFGVRCSFKCDKPVEVDDTEVAVHLYRIAQEAVTNAIKHGRAKNIRMGLAYGPNKSVMTVKSDGLDFPKEFEARGTGMGLQIMDHRADIIGGSLDICKAPKGGTIVTCEFPSKKHSQ
jgi:PAS domain S-box-containing protein